MQSSYDNSPAKTGIRLSLKSLLSQLVGCGRPKRRRMRRGNIAAVGHEVQPVEPRLLLSGVTQPDDHAPTWGTQDRWVPDSFTEMEFVNTSQAWSVAGRIGHISDEDVFRLDLTQPTSLAFFVDGESGPVGTPGDTNPSGVILTDDGTSFRIHLNDHQPVGVNLEAGTHFISVTGNPGFQQGDYLLTAVVSEVPFEADDHPDTISPNIPLTEFDPEFGGWKINGRIQHPRDNDFHRIEITERSVVVGQGISNANFWQEGSGQAPTNRWGQAVLEPGNWYFLVAGGFNFHSGDYSKRFQLVEHSDKTDDHDDFVSSRLPSQQPATDGSVAFTGVLDSANDVDVFRLDVDHTAVVRFTDSWLSYSVAVYNSAEDLVHQVRPSEFEFSAGTWYVAIAAGPESSIGPYQIDASTASFNVGADDHSDTPDSSATVIELDELWASDLAGFFETENDRDVFRLSLSDARYIQLEGVGIPDTGPPVSPGRPFFPTIYNPDAYTPGIRILNETGDAVESELLVAGEYFIEVSSHSGFASASYVVQLSLDDHPAAASDATQLHADESGNVVAAGIINSTSDVDTFQFQLNEPSVVDFEVSGNPQSTPQVVIYPVDSRAARVDLTSDTILGRGTWIVEVRSEVTSLGPFGTLNGHDPFETGHYQVTVQIVGPHVLTDDDHPNEISPAVSFVEFDPNQNEPNTAGEGWTFNGRVDGPEDQDFFRFYVSQRTMVDIFHSTGEYSLRTANGSEPDQVSPFGGILDPGTWYFSVRGPFHQQPTEYSARISVSADDHEDTPSPFIPQLRLRSNGTLDLVGTLEDRFDADTFNVRLTEDSTVTVTLPEDVPHVSIWIGGLRYQESVASGETIDLHAGTWFFQVGQNSDRTVEHYRIGLEETSPDAVPSNSADQPNFRSPDIPLTPFDSANRTWTFTDDIAHINDVDIFRFQVDGLMTVVLSDTNGAAGLVSGNGLRLLPNSSGAYDLTPGDWYLSVSGNPSFQSGTYTVIATASESAIETVVPDSETGLVILQGELVDAAPTDYFRLIVTDSSVVRFADSNSGPQTDVVDKSGQPVQRISGEYRLTAGTWLIRVQAIPTFLAGAYRLEATVTTASDSPLQPQPNPGTRVPFKVAEGVPVRIGEVDLTNVTPLPALITSPGYVFDVPERSNALIEWDNAQGLKIFDENGNIFAPSTTAGTTNRQLRAGKWFIDVESDDASRNVDLSLTVTSVYTDIVPLRDVPSETLAIRPTFRWNIDTDANEYEIFVSRRGEKEAVFRTRGITADNLQLPNSISPGEYTVWLRKHHGENLMSRWGHGHDFTVTDRPQVVLTDTHVRWDAVDNATRYEVWADHIAQDGSLIQQKIVSQTDVAGTQFTIPQEMRNRQLAWWVRAIGDNNGITERSAWSRVAYSQEPQLLDSPGDVLIRPVVTNAVVTGPRVRWTAVTDASEYEIFIGTPGVSEPVFRQRGITGQVFELPGAYDSASLRVWIRALGTGLARSRWVAADISTDAEI